jgi:hypothetical protein
LKALENRSPSVSPIDTPYKLNPGAHAVLARAGAKETTATVQVAMGETQQVELHLDSAAEAAPDTATTPASSSSGVPLVSWVGFGVGAAGLVMGSVTGVMALSREGDLSDKCPAKRCTRDSESDLDGAQTMATLSTIGFIVAGVGAAVGVIGIVAGHRARAPKTGVTASRGSLTAAGTPLDRAGLVRVRLAGPGIRATF